LVFSAFVAWKVGPLTQRGAFGPDIVSAAGYFVNWRLAARSVDYLAEGLTASPVQHYWSLSIEEQFYLLWPLLMLVGVVLARWTRLRLKALLFGLIAVASAASLAASVAITADRAMLAFFVSHTRVWELGIGALLALVATRLARMPRGLADGLGLVGLAAIIGSVWVISDASSWPSYLPLLPCGGTAAVIAAGIQGKTWVGQLLSLRPMVWVGGLSYSLYLWHWPFLVGAASMWGGLGLGRSALVILASCVPAWVCHKIVENPIRFSKLMSDQPKLALSAGLNFMFAGVVAGLVLSLSVPATSSASSSGAVLGAAVIEDDGSNWPDLLAVSSPEAITPDPLHAVDDYPDSAGFPCQPTSPGAPPSCVLGDGDGDVKIALVGDSMMQQWEPAFDIIGKRNGWRIETFTLSTCQFTALYSERAGGSIECHDWGENLLDHLVSTHPDLMIQSQYYATSLLHPDDPDSVLSAPESSQGFHQYWSVLADHGIPVASLIRNPAVESSSPELWPGSIYNCVAEHPTEVTLCVGDADYAVPRSQRKSAKTSPVTVDIIDLNSRICGDGRCPAVVGNALVYRQGIHLTRTFIETLSPQLEEKVLRVLDARGIGAEQGNS